MKIKISKNLLEDNRLSWKAKGIYCSIVALGSDIVSLYELNRVSNSKIDTLESGISELLKHGYLEEYKGVCGYVYLITDSHGNYKIGETSDLLTRMNSYERLLPYFKPIATARHSKHKDTEKRLHRVFKNKRIKGEWFKLDDTEIEKFISSLKEMNCDGIIIYN